MQKRTSMINMPIIRPKDSPSQMPVQWPAQLISIQGLYTRGQKCKQKTSSCGAEHTAIALDSIAITCNLYLTCYWDWKNYDGKGASLDSRQTLMAAQFYDSTGVTPVWYQQGLTYSRPWHIPHLWWQFHNMLLAILSPLQMGPRMALIAGLTTPGWIGV